MTPLKDWSVNGAETYCYNGKQNKTPVTHVITTIVFRTNIKHTHCTVMDRMHQIINLKKKYKNGSRWSVSSENQTRPKKTLSKSILLFGRKKLDCIFWKRSDQKSPVGKQSSSPTKVFKLGFYTTFISLCLTIFFTKLLQTMFCFVLAKTLSKKKSPKIDFTDWNFLLLLEKLAAFLDKRISNQIQT